MFTRVYLSLVLFNCLAQFSRACLHMFTRLLVFTYVTRVYLCLLVFTYVYTWLPLFISVYVCLLIFIYVNPLFTRAYLRFTTVRSCPFAYVNPWLLVFTYLYSRFFYLSLSLPVFPTVYTYMFTFV